MPDNDFISFMLESTKIHNEFKYNVQKSIENLDSKSLSKFYNDFKTYLNRNKNEKEINEDKDGSINKELIKGFFDFFKSSEFDSNKTELYLDICNKYININIIAYYFWFLEDTESAKKALFNGIDRNQLTLENCKYLEQEFDYFKYNRDGNYLQKDKLVLRDSFLKLQEICYNYKTINNNDFQSQNDLLINSPMKKQKI